MLPQSAPWEQGERSCAPGSAWRGSLSQDILGGRLPWVLLAERSAGWAPCMMHSPEGSVVHSPPKTEVLLSLRVAGAGGGGAVRHAPLTQGPE